MTAGSEYPRAVAFFSRYCAHRAFYPPPQAGPARFVDSLLELVRTRPVAVVIAVSAVCCSILARERGKLESYCKMVLPPREAMEVAENKAKTLRLARELGVPVPLSLFHSSASEVAELAGGMRYPLVVKGVEDSGATRYVNNRRELDAAFAEVESRGRLYAFEAPLVQEYVPGSGYGFFALYNRGECRAFFMHRRVREYPSTGGPSSVAESIYDEQLFEFGKKLLDALRWHGVAMVEFKRDARDGQYRLMEINPKFWGSLDLAIAAGVDFPLLLYRMALHGDVEGPSSYQTGLRFRWLLSGDILRALSGRAQLASFLRDFFSRPTRYDLNPSDPLPSLYLGAGAVLQVVKVLRDRSLLYPYGVPRVQR